MPGHAPETFGLLVQLGKASPLQAASLSPAAALLFPYESGLSSGKCQVPMQPLFPQLCDLDTQAQSDEGRGSCF